MREKERGRNKRGRWQIDEKATIIRWNQMSNKMLHPNFKSEVPNLQPIDSYNTTLASTSILLTIMSIAKLKQPSLRSYLYLNTRSVWSVSWSWRIHWLRLCKEVEPPTQWESWIWHKTIWWWGSSNAGALGNVEHLFIAIAPRSTLARNGSTW